MIKDSEYALTGILRAKLDMSNTVTRITVLILPLYETTSPKS